MIAPVVPPLLSASGRVAGPGVVGLVRGPLPLPSLIFRRTSRCSIGCRRSMIGAGSRIGSSCGRWAGLLGSVLTFRKRRGFSPCSPTPAVVIRSPARGHLRLPAPLRHRYGLEAGDRVLLAADPGRSRLSVYPPAALDNLLPRQSTDTAGGESA